MEIRTINVDIDIELIQVIRIIQALSELDIRISIPVNEKYKFFPLLKKFNFNFSQFDHDGIMLSHILDMNHEEPYVKIGNIVRPLLFPHEITKYCYNIWKKQRRYKYIFIGLLTHKRKQVISEWIEKNQINCKQLNNLPYSNLIGLLINKFQQFFNTFSCREYFKNNLFLVSSVKGRSFPDKSWDEEYYKYLSSSKFVLCPNGDFVWSYRFFEAILCGAIPIIEEFAHPYSGFIYKTINDDVNNFFWNREDALYNYNLCVEKITIDKDHFLNDFA